jgi:hypothetical protein
LDLLWLDRKIAALAPPEAPPAMRPVEAGTEVLRSRPDSMHALVVREVQRFQHKIS